MAKNLKTDISNLRIKAKKQDRTIPDTNNIITLIIVFYIYTQIFLTLDTLDNKLQLKLALGKYAKHLVILQKIYI